MLADPRLAVVQCIQVLQQFHVPLQRQDGVLVQGMERREEDAAAEIGHWGDSRSFRDPSWSKFDRGSMRRKPTQRRSPTKARRCPSAGREATWASIPDVAGPQPNTEAKRTLYPHRYVRRNIMIDASTTPSISLSGGSGSISSLRRNTSLVWHKLKNCSAANAGSGTDSRPR